ncbi:MAG: HDIG domain-containing protein [Deltaproteobacteria bacterium]|nr:HDIG domain-containing protein [Deltaproteobacteria bacterium]
MARVEMPPHVIRHSQVVCGLAVYLAKKLIGLGRPIDLELIRAGGLLHDITKRYSFDRPLDHALTGSKLLRKLGYPHVARIVRQHVRISASRPQGRISEPEIVNYADKRVVNDTVVTLEDRFIYIKDRYARTEMARIYIDQMSAWVFGLEEEIFQIIPGGAEQLLALDTGSETLARYLDDLSSGEDAITV